MDIRNCPNCGGDHYGSIKCPYIKAPCVVCGDGTVTACADCAIERRGSVHVCSKTECRDRHEAEFHPPKTQAQKDEEDWRTIRAVLACGGPLPDRLQRIFDRHMEEIHVRLLKAAGKQ